MLIGRLELSGRKSVDEEDIESRPVWDENLATELIGKLLLVGLTHCNSDGSVDRQEQLFGIVQSTDKNSGILLNLKGTRASCRYNLPPDLRSCFQSRSRELPPALDERSCN